MQEQLYVWSGTVWLGLMFKQGYPAFVIHKFKHFLMTFPSQIFKQYTAVVSSHMHK